MFEHIPGKINPTDDPSDYAKNASEVENDTIFPKSAFRLFATTAARRQHKPTDDLRARLVKTLAQDKIAQQYIVDQHTTTTNDAGALRQNDATAPRRSKYERSWAWDDDLLLYDNLIYIPNDDALRLEIMRMHHDDAMAEHYGTAKTLELLSWNYYFPGMSSYVKKYVNICDICARGKAPRHPPHGELAPLPVPTGPWKGISCDYVVDLPKSHGYDAILVFIDRLTKMSHFIPCAKTTTAPDFARMFLDHIVHTSPRAP